MSSKLPRQPFRYLPLRIITSIRTITRFFYSKPRYVFVAMLLSIVFYQLVFWSLNLGLMGYLLMAPFLSLADRFDILLSSYTSLLTQPYSTLGLLLLAVSLLQGMSLAMLLYAIRRERQQAKSFAGVLGGTSITSALSVFGLGCAACGTSLVTPILTFFFATSSISVAEQVGEASALLALVAAIITLYLLGLKQSVRP